MDRIKDVLDAIRSVKTRLLRALLDGNTADYNKLMGDLLALENCLVTECEEYIKRNQAA